MRKKEVNIVLLDITDFTFKSKPLEVSYQLLQVVLYGVWVNHNADSDQGVESKVKYLVAEKWDDPGGTQLKQRYVFYVLRLMYLSESRETSLAL